MNDAQKLAIWLEVAKAAIMSPAAANRSGDGPRSSEYAANFAVDVADRVTREIDVRSKGKP